MSLRIGARGSALSLAQTAGVRAAIAAALGAAAETLPIIPITTTGDRIQDRRLIEAGGKGLFTKELDEALLDGRIDLAVHSMKDLPTRLPDGIALGAAPARADPRDAFICLSAARLEDLPAGARVGTASLRRQAQVLAARPDLTVLTLRGNVETRLRKIQAGEVDATFLALAGLQRLGLQAHARSVLDVSAMPPAAGQGALAVTARADDAATLRLLQQIEDPMTRLEIEAERAFLAALDGSCRTPIAALGRAGGGALIVIGEPWTPVGAKR
ncbi:MAG: hydroxymethylbilane synthase, partial [Hyphomonadaceae bacterium]